MSPDADKPVATVKANVLFTVRAENDAALFAS